MSNTTFISTIILAITAYAVSGLVTNPWVVWTLRIYAYAITVLFTIYLLVFIYALVVAIYNTVSKKKSFERQMEKYLKMGEKP